MPNIYFEKSDIAPESVPDAQTQITNLYVNTDIDDAHMGIYVFNNGSVSKTIIPISKPVKKLNTDNEREEQISVVATVPEAVSRPIEKLNMTKWYENPEAISLLVKTAKELLRRYPNEVIFSLGQSPGWFLKAAEELTANNPSIKKRSFGYIPFSGSFYSKIPVQKKFVPPVNLAIHFNIFNKCKNAADFLNLATGRAGEHRYISEKLEQELLEYIGHDVNLIQNEYVPKNVSSCKDLLSQWDWCARTDFTGWYKELRVDVSSLSKFSSSEFSSFKFACFHRPPEEKKYRDYLDSIGFSPQKIIERFYREKTKTVLLEYIQSGAGLASFVSIIFLWAREEGLLSALQYSLEICALTTYLEPDVLQLPEDDLTISLKQFKIHSRWMQKIVDGTKDSDDRLVPYYNENSFHIPPEELMPDNSATHFIILRRIRMEIQEGLPKQVRVADFFNLPNECEKSPASVNDNMNFSNG